MLNLVLLIVNYYEWGDDNWKDIAILNIKYTLI